LGHFLLRTVQVRIGPHAAMSLGEVARPNSRFGHPWQVIGAIHPGSHHRAASISVAAATLRRSPEAAIHGRDINQQHASWMSRLGLRFDRPYFLGTFLCSGPSASGGFPR
jgi:hypothetical protein